MNIEAMKQALEALENASEYIQAEHDQRKEMYEPYGMVHKYSTEAQNLLDNKQAITSLRQAISEAEKRKPTAWIYKPHRELLWPNEVECTTPIEKNEYEPLYTTPPAAPVQKPVALETVYETIINWDEGGGKRSRRELARRIVDLYTTPQPQQEPVAWVNWCAATGNRSVSFECESELASQPLYFGITQITQNHYSNEIEWVGLTQEDIDIAFDDTQEGGGFNEFARAIEAKLRFKNT
jgi:hypothetical protein